MGFIKSRASISHWFSLRSEHSKLNPLKVGIWILASQTKINKIQTEKMHEKSFDKFLHQCQIIDIT